ncbi:hypothetical protein HDV03_005431 [Kappamyces sp. JEL0829]|nr:hypothetical protein HDV03_005431 [Kappamyces sp. JEL0829]
MDGFVEISEQDTGLYKYLKEKGVESLEDCGLPEYPALAAYQDPHGHLAFKLFRSGDSSNTTLAGLPPPIQTNNLEIPAKPKKSKNAIFEQSFKISKPVTQMTKRELAEFRGSILEDENEGNAPVTTPRLPFVDPLSAEGAWSPETSMMVPLTLPSRRSTPHPPDEVPIADAAFLGMDTSRNSCISHPYPAVLGLQDAAKSTLLRASASRPIYLSFLPLAKNVLGYGQYSTVYLGTYQFDGESQEYPCAIKRVNKGDEGQALAITESYLLSHIVHPSIITLIGTKNENDGTDHAFQDKISAAFANHSLLSGSPRILLVLEYCSNGHLWSWMAKHHNRIGRKLWMKWATELASGINYLHSLGIIHHDLKPHNILLTDVLDVRISDFGNAKVVPEAESNSRPSAQLSPISPGFGSNIPESQRLADGLGKGTAGYIAPELYDTENLQYSFPVDIYSLGIVFYVMISEKQPFANCTSPVQAIMGCKRGFFASKLQPLVGWWKNPDPEDGQWQYPDGEKVDGRIVDIVMQMVALSPSDRPGMFQVVNALHSIYNGLL